MYYICKINKNMKAKLVKESLNKAKTIHPSDIEVIKNTYGFGPQQYGDYIVNALEQLAERGYEVPLFQEISDEVYKIMEMAWNENEGGDADEKAKDIIDVLSDYPFPKIVKDWPNIMTYLSDGELSYNDHFPGIMDAQNRFAEDHKEEIEESGTDIGGWLENFTDIATYLTSTPHTGPNKYKMRDIVTGKINRTNFD